VTKTTPHACPAYAPPDDRDTDDQESRAGMIVPNDSLCHSDVE